MSKAQVTKAGIGYSPLTEKIYIGNRNREKRAWTGQKSDITNDFISIMFEYIPENTQRTIKGGDREAENYLMNVKKDRQGIEKAIRWLNKQLEIIK